MCEAVRNHMKRQVDSVLAIKPADWRPDPADDSLRVAVASADVVVQVRVDTLGHLDIRTFRVLRWRESRFIALARSHVSQLDLEPYEMVPGCKAPYLATLPFRFSAR